MEEAKGQERELLINDIYIPALQCKDRYLFLFGGKGSGKSDLGVVKVLLRLQSTDKHKFLFIRKVKDTIKESLFALVQEVIERDFKNIELFNINKTDKSITYKPNGNKIIMTGVDDREKLKSIAGITGVLIEEVTELDEEDYNEIDSRLRGETDDYKQIIAMFNPVDEEHWLKPYVEPDNVEFERIKSDYIEDESRVWRFYDQSSNGNKIYTCVFNTTFEHNYFIGDEYESVLDKQGKFSANAMTVNKLGRWGKKDSGILRKDFFEIVHMNRLPPAFWSQPKYFVADLAYTDKDKNDPTGVLCFRVFQNQLWLLDYMTYREKFEANKDKIIEFLIKHDSIHSPFWIENKAGGLDMVDSLIVNYGINAIAYKVGSKDKTARLMSIIDFIYAKRVKIVGGNWEYKRYISQLTSFPNAKHDEEVDCLTMAVNISQTPMGDSGRKYRPIN